MLKTTVVVAAAGCALGQGWSVPQLPSSSSTSSGWSAPQIPSSSSFGSWSTNARTATPSWSSTLISGWGYPSITPQRSMYGSMYPTKPSIAYPSSFRAPVVAAPAPVVAAPAPATSSATLVSSVASPGPVTKSAWEIALLEAGFSMSSSGDPVWAKSVKVSPTVTIEPPLPVYDPNTISRTSPPSYPEEWGHNWNHKNVATPVATPAKTEQRIQASTVPLNQAAASRPWNQMYATLPVEQAAVSVTSLSKVPRSQNPLYEQLPVDNNNLGKSELEARYGKQLSADGPPALASYTKKPLRGMTKEGPAIGAGGTFRETKPSIINMPRTGKPVISYDFHGVIQNCPGRNMPCNVMNKVVDQLREDAKTSDIIITTAGVPEGNDEIVSYLRDEAKVWNLITELYNSGSKWEVMAALSVVRHYDDQMDNLVRINSRVTGLGLVLVDPRTERMTLHMA